MCFHCPRRTSDTPFSLLLMTARTRAKCAQGGVGVCVCVTVVNHLCGSGTVLENHWQNGVKTDTQIICFSSTGNMIYFTAFRKLIVATPINKDRIQKVRAGLRLADNSRILAIKNIEKAECQLSRRKCLFHCELICFFLAYSVMEIHLTSHACRSLRLMCII